MWIKKYRFFELANLLSNWLMLTELKFAAYAPMFSSSFVLCVTSFEFFFFWKSTSYISLSIYLSF